MFSYALIVGVFPQFLLRAKMHEEWKDATLFARRQQSASVYFSEFLMKSSQFARNCLQTISHHFARLLAKGVYAHFGQNSTFLWGYLAYSHKEQKGRVLAPSATAPVLRLLSTIRRPFHRPGSRVVDQSVSMIGDMLNATLTTIAFNVLALFSSLSCSLSDMTKALMKRAETNQQAFSKVSCALAFRVDRADCELRHRCCFQQVSMSLNDRRWQKACSVSRI